MARKISEIKKTMTDAFMADETLRTAYGLSQSDSFDNCFSKVSVENLLIYIVAACEHILEVMFDAFKEDVDSRIGHITVSSIPWYHNLCKAFQYGDSLVYNEKTCAFEYTTVDESKKVVRYAAVRDLGGSISILGSGDKDGSPIALDSDILTAFKYYLNKVKVVGVIIEVRSLPADTLSISATVQVDPLVIDKSGKRISDDTFPVVKAVNAYLADIVYGGTFNKTKLVDAIQAVDGVADVVLGGCLAKPDGATVQTNITTNNYTAVSGCFISTGLENSIRYVV